MRYLDLFSGIGGFTLGIQQAYEANNNSGRESEQRTKEQGVRHQSDKSDSTGSVGDGRREYPTCVGYSEIDKYAIQIYEKHFNHKNYGDITKINAKELPDFDLIVGGFPCQAFSIAGKRGGFSDTRGTLFFEIARIIKQKQPRLLLLENVKGLLSHDKGKTFATIISTLDELGYDCQWQVLNSKDHGVPQNRERVFIIGHLRNSPRPKVFPFGGTDETTTGDRSVPRVRARGGLQNHAGEMVEQSPALTEAMGKGGGQTPIIQQLNQPKHSNDRIYGEEGISPTLNTMQGERRQPKIAKTVRSSGRGSGYGDKRNWDEYLVDGKIRRLTPRECEKLQGFPRDWTEKGINEKGEEVDVSDTQRYKTLGNAVTVNVIEDIMSKLI